MLGETDSTKLSLLGPQKQGALCGDLLAPRVRQQDDRGSPRRPVPRACRGALPLLYVASVERFELSSTGAGVMNVALRHDVVP